ncbi:hypothetical protein HNP67_001225 [Borreliella californiensis]|uniref:Uncharacterized protein n=1 Tax=Borreliella californiensis TaxID=373543 RepID=A0A7W9ZLI9_9SPIR|nr:hypothetical protein [Borreliella californiensis]
MELKFTISLIILKKNVTLKSTSTLKKKKDSRFKFRVNNYFKDNVNKHSSVELVECLNNKNINIKEEKRNNQIEKYQIKNYFNKCNFKSKKFLSILNLDINKKTKIDIMKIIKQVEIELIRSFNIHVR